MVAQCARSVLASAIDTFTVTVRAGAGVFAPGHLGELTRFIPFELVDAVLEETRAVERRLRLLPSRVGVYCWPWACSLIWVTGWCGAN